MLSILDLPPAVLIEVFSHLQESPSSFLLTCRTFFAIANEPTSIASYLFRRYGPLLMLERTAMRYPRILKESVLTILLNRKVYISRSFLQRLLDKKTWRFPIRSETIAWLFTHGSRVLGSFDAMESDTQFVILTIKNVHNLWSTDGEQGKTDATRLQDMLVAFVEQKNYYPVVGDTTTYLKLVEGMDVTPEDIGRHYPKFVGFLLLRMPKLTKLLARRGFSFDFFIDKQTIIRKLALLQPKWWWNTQDMINLLQEFIDTGMVTFNTVIWGKLLRHVGTGSYSFENWENLLNVISALKLPFDPITGIVERIKSIDAADPRFSRHILVVPLLSNAWMDAPPILEAVKIVISMVPRDHLQRPIYHEVLGNHRLDKKKEFVDWLMGGKGAGPGRNHPIATYMMDFVIALASNYNILSPLFTKLVDWGTEVTTWHLQWMINCTNEHCIEEFLNAVIKHGIYRYDVEDISLANSEHSKKFFPGLPFLKDFAQRSRGSDEIDLEKNMDMKNMDMDTETTFDRVLVLWLCRHTCIKSSV